MTYYVMESLFPLGGSNVFTFFFIVLWPSTYNPKQVHLYIFRYIFVYNLHLLVVYYVKYKSYVL